MHRQNHAKGGYHGPRELAAAPPPASGGVVQLTAEVFPDGTLRRRDAAAYLGLRPATLVKMAQRGEGPPFHIFRNRAYYRKVDLDEFREAQTRLVEPAHPSLDLG